MGNAEKTFSEPYLDDRIHFVNGEKTNPYARIGCKTRTNIPTLCDGTCGGCRKSRAEFFAQESQRMLGHELINPTYGPGIEEQEPPTIEDCESRLLQRISHIHDIKGVIIAKRVALHARVNKRVAELMVQRLAEKPDS